MTALDDPILVPRRPGFRERFRVMLRPQGLEFNAVVIGGFDAERLPHRCTVATDDLVSAGGGEEPRRRFAPA